MTVKPAGLEYEIEVGDDTPLFTKRADLAAFKRNNVRLIPFIAIAAAVFMTILSLDGYWWIGLMFVGLLAVFAVYLFVFTKPKLSYFVTSNKVGLADRASWGYYEYRDVRRVVLRPFARTITLRGPGSQPVRIDLYLSQEDYDWFVADIVPQFPNAVVKGKTKNNNA